MISVLAPSSLAAMMPTIWLPATMTAWPLAMRSGLVRRFVFRDVAEHGERLSAAQAIDAVDDLLGCSIIDDILSSNEEIALLDALPCPVTLAWSGNDAILPLAVNGEVARTRIPDARFVVLPGVGHVPMIDDTERVLAVILQTTQQTKSVPSAILTFDTSANTGVDID